TPRADHRIVRVGGPPTEVAESGRARTRRGGGPAFPTRSPTHPAPPRPARRAVSAAPLPRSRRRPRRSGALSRTQDESCTARYAARPAARTTPARPGSRIADRPTCLAVPRPWRTRDEPRARLRSRTSPVGAAPTHLVRAPPSARPRPDSRGSHCHQTRHLLLI